jgi:hypothetical protein
MNNTEIENMSTPERVLELIKVSSVLAERAKLVEKKASATAVSLNQLIPGVVEACVTCGDVRESQRGEFTAALGDHSQTLRMLHKMATLRAKSNAQGNQQTTEIGGPVRTEKTASHNSRNAEAPSLTRLRAALKLS